MVETDTGPNELDPFERPQIALPLLIPNMFQDRCERRDADPSSDQNGNFGLEDIFRWSSKSTRTIRRYGNS